MYSYPKQEKTGKYDKPSRCVMSVVNFIVYVYEVKFPVLSCIEQYWMSNDHHRACRSDRLVSLVSMLFCHSTSRVEI